MRLVCAALLCLLAASAAADDTGSRGQQPGAFDFYVLSLSWSPSYCAGSGSDSSQCAGGGRHGFVVHGLWPQYEEGWPQFCYEKRRNIPRSLVDSMLDIMPSPQLVYAQWDKHGTCSGLSAADYFDKTRQAGAAVRIPEAFGRTTGAVTMSAGAIESAFIEANPGLEPDMIAVDCEGRLLGEVRICLDKELGFRSCPEVDRKACGRRSVSVPGPAGVGDGL